jgi:hypothetical protein
LLRLGRALDRVGAPATTACQRQVEAEERMRVRVCRN